MTNDAPVVPGVSEVLTCLGSTGHTYGPWSAEQYM